MRSLSTAISLALTLSVFSMALPQGWEDLQGHQRQISFGPTEHHLKAKDDGAYARFDHDQVLRVQVADLEELKRLEAVIEVDILINSRITCCPVQC
jgi:2'-5' RNA ligase